MNPSGNTWHIDGRFGFVSFVVRMTDKIEKTQDKFTTTTMLPQYVSTNTDAIVNDTNANSDNNNFFEKSMDYMKKHSIWFIVIGASFLIFLVIAAVVCKVYCCNKNGRRYSNSHEKAKQKDEKLFDQFSMRQTNVVASE